MKWDPDDYPAHPTPMPLYGHRGYGRIPTELPVEVLWVWQWRTCDGSFVQYGKPPAMHPCQQFGACVIHDPPGTVVPW